MTMNLVLLHRVLRPRRHLRFGRGDGDLEALPSQQFGQHAPDVEQFVVVDDHPIARWYVSGFLSFFAPKNSCFIYQTQGCH